MRCHFPSSALLETAGWHYHINRPVRGHHRFSHHPHKSTEDKLCKSLYTTGKKTTLTQRYGPLNCLQWRWGFRLKWRTRIKQADWIWHLINSAIIKGEKEHWLNVRAERYSGWSLWLFNELWDGTIQGRFIARCFNLFSLTGIYTHTGINLKH